MNTERLILLLVCAVCAIGFTLIGIYWRRDRAGWSRQVEGAWQRAHENTEEKQRLATELAGYKVQAAERIGVLVENNRGLQTRLSARNVSWTMPAKLPSRSEIRRAFAVDNEAPLWVAFNAELDSFLQDLIDQVSLPPGPTMSEEARTHLAGGIEEVRKFQKRVLDLQAAAKTVDADIAGEGPEKKGGDV